MEMEIGKLKPSVCVDAVFEGVPLEQSVKTVADLGYPAFEFWCWWEKDLAQLNDLRREYSLKIASCCTKFISLTRPECRKLYLEGLEKSIEAAKTLDCNILISQVGDFVLGVDRADQQKSLVEGLTHAAKLLDGSGVKLVIEPLNEKVDHAGYYLIRSDEAFEIIEKVGSPNVQVVFDIYHQQISEGDLLTNILDNLENIGHFHAAGNPGRHELNSGEIHYPEIFKAIGAAGFEGYVGLEYWPENDPIQGLGQVARWFDRTEDPA
ncbi:MAG: TIM barrel protein [Planctomycetota bacterium]|nr:TIM barrel protein [Planctomycetota bacterium]